LLGAARPSRSLRHPENNYHRPPGLTGLSELVIHGIRAFLRQQLSLIANLPSPRYLLSSLLVFPEFCDLILAAAIAQISLPAFIHLYRDPSERCLPITRTASRSSGVEALPLPSSHFCAIAPLNLRLLMN